jgi:hypothetical protein
MKSICENVSAGPVIAQSINQSVRDPRIRRRKEGLGRVGIWGPRIIGVWMSDELRRTDIRLCAEQFLVSPDITTVIIIKELSTPN